MPRILMVRAKSVVVEAQCWDLGVCREDAQPLGWRGVRVAQGLRALLRGRIECGVSCWCARSYSSMRVRFSVAIPL